MVFFILLNSLIIKMLLRTKHWQVLNHCLLIAKYCIICTSLRGDVLDFKNFLLFIPGKLETLKEIATAKKALPKFYRTWAFLLL